MFRGEHLMRAETSDGLVYVSDGAAGKCLIYDARKNAQVLDEPPHQIDIYGVLTRTSADSATPLGTASIDGRSAVGFRLVPGVSTTDLWVDAETHLPLQLKAKTKGPDGREPSVIVDQFVLDAPLDDALFSLAIPEGYAEGPVQISDVDAKLTGGKPSDTVGKPGARTYVAAADRAKELKLCAESARAASKILQACLMYAVEHNNQWPADLQSVVGHGLTEADLVNPRRPGEAVGWIYRRPDGKVADPSGTVVLYEPLDPWDDGVNVGFADGHVQFMSDRAGLEKMIASSSPRRVRLWLARNTYSPP